MIDKTADENVIPFPARSRRPPDESTEERRAALSKEQFERSDTNARRVFDATIKKRPIIQKESERVTIAKNLGQILDELESGSPSISKRQVLHAAGQGKGTDSTKRLPYFAMKSRLSEEDIRRKSKKLTKHIAKYLSIIYVIPSLVNVDKWVLTQRLVEGTSYSPSNNVVDSAVEDLKFEGWDNIATAMQDIARRVSNKYDLPRFFERVRALGIEERLGGLSQRMRSSPKQRDLQGTPLPALIGDEELPPRPSAYLGAIRVCDDIPCTVRVRLGSGEGEKESELRGRLIDAGIEDESVKGLAAPVLHVDVELLPLGRQNIVAPVLRLRPMTYIRSAKEFAEFLPFGGNKWKRGEEVGNFDGPIEPDENFVENDMKDSQLAAFDVESESFVDCQIEVEFESDDLQPQYDGSLHSRSAVDRAWVGRFDDWAKGVLSGKPLTRRVGSLFERYCYATASEMDEIGIKDVSGQAFTLSLGGTMAALLERSIFDAPEAARLDQLIDKAAGTLVAELESKIEEVRIRHDKRLDELRRD